MKIPFCNAVCHSSNLCNYSLTQQLFYRYGSCLEKHHCYDNADYLMRELFTQNIDIQMVYGYVVSGVAHQSGVYIPHGWNLVNGQCVDLTSLLYGYDEIDIRNFGYVPYYILNMNEYEVLTNHLMVMPDVLMQQDTDFQQQLNKLGYFFDESSCLYI